MKKVLISLLIIILAVFAVPKMIDIAKELFTEDTVKQQLTLETDEEKIEFVINTFNEAYRNGDFDGVTNCFTKRNENTQNAQFGITSRILSSVLNWLSKGFLNLDKDAVGDMWTLGTELYNMKFDVSYIELEDENNAVAYGNIIQSAPAENISSSIEGYMEMKKENGIWLIDNMIANQ